MSTRSYIGILNSDNSVDYVYCHYDGYPEYNGVILSEYYNNEDIVRDLISLGDLSSLDRELSAPEGIVHDFDQRHPGVSVFYGRDRGDDQFIAKTTSVDEYLSKDFGKESWIEFRYLFDPKSGWKVVDSESPVSQLVVS